MKLLKGIGGFIVLSGPLFFLLIYFVIAVVLSIIAARQGAKRGKKRWGLYTALVFILIMFWDLPLVLGTRWYQCTNNAGFTVHKTLEQWQQENPGVVETLSPDKLPEQYFSSTAEVYPGQKNSGVYRFYHYPNGAELRAEFTKKGKLYMHRFNYPGIGKGDAHWLNGRFAWLIQRTPRLMVGKVDERIVDLETGEILAQSVDFASHPSGGRRWDWNPLNLQSLKFWLRHRSCPAGEYPNPRWLVGGDSLVSLRKKIIDINGDIQ
ncbi:MAG: hypothetical protein KUG81_07815 [Gammaproteobacteria bacterium]|nr:hypothetical protein [Gammaproteobacteria bacterium]